MREAFLIASLGFAVAGVVRAFAANNKEEKDGAMMFTSIGMMYSSFYITLGSLQ